MHPCGGKTTQHWSGGVGLHVGRPTRMRINRNYITVTLAMSMCVLNHILHEKISLITLCLLPKGLASGKEEKYAKAAIAI